MYDSVTYKDVNQSGSDDERNNSRGNDGEAKENNSRVSCFLQSPY
jgi:hypothetical protein